MIVDANVLLYAVDDQSHFHTTARTWLDDAMNGTAICSFDSDFARFDGLHWINPDRR